MAGESTNEKSQARPRFAARLFLMLCVFLCGGILGGGAAEWALSLRRQAVTVRPDPVRALPAFDPVQGRMNVNAAALEDIQQAPGIGPVLAEAIVRYREAVGGFYFLEELKDVPGIGAAKFEALKELFYCGSYVQPSVAP